MIKLPKKKYTPKQDVQLGKEAASEVRKQYPIIEDQHIAKYLTQIGNRLVAAAPTELKQSVYEYSFTPVNLKDINAFALPGGPMFVQRGMFDAAAEEAEVAGVMAHELSRVLLRHGTANASKAQNPWLQLGQIAGAVGGAVVGGELGGYIAEGTQFGLGTLLVRYSRDYEKQADLLGAQIMARAGYDPRALAHAPSRSASIRLNKTATWFQMALFWSTILRSPFGRASDGKPRELTLRRRMVSSVAAKPRRRTAQVIPVDQAGNSSCLSARIPLHSDFFCSGFFRHVHCHRSRVPSKRFVYMLQSQSEPGRFYTGRDIQLVRSTGRAQRRRLPAHGETPPMESARRRRVS